WDTHGPPPIHQTVGWWRVRWEGAAYPFRERQRLVHLLLHAQGGGELAQGVAGARRCAGPRGQRKLFGQIIVRHMCATGELSNPRPSSGSRKWRPMMSVKISGSTSTPSWKEYTS